jgi:hypothetical protein
MNGEQLIGADAEAAVAEFLGDGGEIFNVIFAAIEEHEIVARAVHFSELQLHNKPLTLNPQP